MVPSWEHLHAEALTHFQNLVRLDTSNPPGNEKRVTDYLASVLAKEDIPYQVIESAPHRANLVARLNSGTSEGPLLLSSHVDVVPAEAGKWTHPPFEGKIEGGFLWGRGTVDMKNMTAMSLMVLLAFKRLGRKLKRDLVFAAVADEECGSALGSRFLVEHHPDLIRAEYALTEVGGFTVYAGSKHLYPIQVAEKGFATLRVRAKGDAGHGSLPHGESAIANLARAIDRIHRNFLPRHLHPVAEGFIRALADGYGFPASLFLKGVIGLGGPFGDFILKKLPDRATARFLIATTHNTLCPTVVEAGHVRNVIPSEATLYLDGRILPHMTQETFLREVHQLLGPSYDIEVVAEAHGNETPVDTPLFHTLKSVIEERDPGAVAVPYLISGFTDASAYQALGIKTYGFTPIYLPPGLVFSSLYHNHDERIPVAGFQWGFETLFEAVSRFCIL